MKRIGMVDDSSCRFCGEEEDTTLHLLLDCNAVVNKMPTCLGTYQLEEAELPELEPKKILNFIMALGLDDVL